MSPLLSRVSYSKGTGSIIIRTAVAQVGIASTSLYDNIGGLASYMNGFLSE